MASVNTSLGKMPCVTMYYGAAPGEVPGRVERYCHPRAWTGEYDMWRGPNMDGPTTFTVVGVVADARARSSTS